MDQLNFARQYMFYHKDPRRIQPIVDFLMESFNSMDYNAEMSFDAVKIITLFRSFYEELGRKFSSWVDDTVRKSWGEIYSEHDDVGNFIAPSPILIELE
jgi:proteasome activator subunit 4